MSEPQSQIDRQSRKLLPATMCLVLLFSCIVWQVLSIVLLIVGWRSQLLHDYHVLLTIGVVLMLAASSYGAIIAMDDLLVRRRPRVPPGSK